MLVGWAGKNNRREWWLGQKGKGWMGVVYVIGYGRTAHYDYNIFSPIRPTGYSQTSPRLFAVPQNDLIPML
jgi:hypothetical protein